MQNKGCDGLTNKESVKLETINLKGEVFDLQSTEIRSFRGGIHPPYNKEGTQHVAVRQAKEPATVTIPMSLHIGAPCKPVVKKGDTVAVGQKVGEATSFVSAPVHASVSGTVKAVEERPHPNGSNVLSVVIESDGKDTVDPAIKPYGDYQQYSSSEIINIIKEAGIVGLGGATFPTHVKLTVSPDKHVDSVILNGAECEPYLTADDHLMQDRPEKVIAGLHIAMRALDVSKGYIAIEDNKPDAINAIVGVCKGDDAVEVIRLKTKYPQGAEKQLITAVTGREVPSGGLPADAGVVVMNVGTAAQVATTFETGMPLYKRYVTCTGDVVKNPATLEVLVGMSYQEVIDECGGFVQAPAKVISGGPMMGVAMLRTDIPVMKGTSGVLCLSKEAAQTPKPTACIRCGRCASVCPIHLQPFLLADYAQHKRWEDCDELHALDCVECGSCSFICPAKRTLVSSIRVGKRQVQAERKKKAVKKNG